MTPIVLCLGLAASLAVEGDQVHPVRELIDLQGRSIVHYEIGNYEGPGCYLDCYTVSRPDLQRQPEWNGSGPVPMPVEALIAKASAAAKATRGPLEFQSFRIEPCHDDPKKMYAVVTFSDDQATHMDLFQREIYLLLDGTPVEASRTSITEAQFHRIWEHGLAVRDF
ncbi:MAG: hypothetical protein AB1714_28985 [Acidobacteriota bacterium]